MGANSHSAVLSLPKCPCNLASRVSVFVGAADDGKRGGAQPSDPVRVPPHGMQGQPNERTERTAAQLEEKSLYLSALLEQLLLDMLTHGAEYVGLQSHAAAVSPPPPREPVARAAAPPPPAGDMDVDVSRLRHKVTKRNRYHTRIALLAHMVQHAPQDTRLQVLPALADPLPFWIWPSR